MISIVSVLNVICLDVYQLLNREVDWEKLGNPGWNWKNYQKYVRKTERRVHGFRAGFRNAEFLLDL